MTGADAGSAAERQIARITLAAERDYVVGVLAFVRATVRALGLAASEAGSLERAVEAVCLNVVERAFAPGQRASFDVSLLRRPGHIVAVVEDRGVPFDYASLEAGAGSDAPASWLSGLADAVRFENLGTAGNRVEIVKRLPSTSIDACIVAGHAAPVAPATSGPSSGPVTLRLMTGDDAMAVARCTYACYGYTLPDDYLYFPDRMREMLHGGLLEVCVGTAPDGEVVSLLTSEVEHPGAPVGYIGEGLVDPRFRHHGLLEQMLQFAKRRARERGMLALYAEAVTVHPFSQRSNLAVGFTETGVQLGDEAPVEFKQMGGAPSQKRTATVLHFLKTNEGPRRGVHVPAHHRAMIERVYAHGGFQRTIEDASPAAMPSAGARLRVDVFPEWSEAAIRVIAYGADLPSLVGARLRELCLRRIDWICLDLPLSDPGAAEVGAALEDLGFFFAGILPDLVGDDVLRLQYLNEIEPEVASAQLASDFGKDLFGYVVRAMTSAPDGPRRRADTTTSPQDTATSP